MAAKGRREFEHLFGFNSEVDGSGDVLDYRPGHVGIDLRIEGIDCERRTRVRLRTLDNPGSSRRRKQHVQYSL